ncbi:hypothetical protein BO78DRAFT_416230 [Aspergillus sclerotiicarbonarius CBS 121057]|uniref:Uncharacterized protein n=1 Tax=Aspergillus sclerotiicarbonarius (strain CBS 121057 / IBT 28362) TaxID=1448318 RepID=A0A319EHK3_ASPSB|nr:hypothetical protein BO78DRAFT_416230 [Aspergillus sclerotiicarbonarius CBS 121057]
MFAAASNDGKNCPDGIAWPARHQKVIWIHPEDPWGNSSTSWLAERADIREEFSIRTLQYLWDILVSYLAYWRTDKFDVDGPAMPFGGFPSASSKKNPLHLRREPFLERFRLLTYALEWMIDFGYGPNVLEQNVEEESTRVIPREYGVNQTTLNKHYEIEPPTLRMTAET